MELFKEKHVPSTKHQITLLVAQASHELLKHGQDFIRRSDGPLLLLSSSPWASNDLIYGSADGVRWSTHRFTLKQLAREIARPSLAQKGVVIAERLPLEATLTQIVDEERASLTYFRDVAGTPHFCAALYNTLNELRSEGIAAPQLAIVERGGDDLALLLTKYQTALQRHGLADEYRLLSDQLRSFLQCQLSQVLSLSEERWSSERGGRRGSCNKGTARERRTH